MNKNPKRSSSLKTVEKKDNQNRTAEREHTKSETE